MGAFLLFILSTINILPVFAFAQELPNIANPLREELIYQQRCLTLMSYNPGSIDGVNNSQFQSAFLEWSRKYANISTDIKRLIFLFYKDCDIARKKVAQNLSLSDGSKIPYGIHKQDILNILGKNPYLITGKNKDTYWWYFGNNKIYYGLYFRDGIYLELLLTNWKSLFEHNFHGPQIKKQQSISEQYQSVDLADSRSGFHTKLWKSGPAPGVYQNIEPPIGVREVTYESGALSLKAWVSDDPGNGVTLPAVVFLHGNHSFAPSDWFYVDSFLKAGFALMIPMLRGENGNPGSYEGYFGEVDDAVAAGHFVAALPYVDSSRVFLAGHSVGALLALLTTMTPSPYKAAAVLDGFYHTPRYTFSPYYFDPEDPDEMRLRNPMAFVPSLRIPLALLSRNDKRARRDDLRFVRMAKLYGKTCKLITVPGDHNTMLVPGIPLTIQWFRQHMSAPTVQTVPVTKDEVKRVLELWNQSRNPEELLKLVSPDATIGITLLYANQQYTVNLTHPKYYRLIEKGFGVTPSHEYHPVSLRLHQSVDGKSWIAVRQIIGKNQIQGRFLHFPMTETIHFSPATGRPIITTIEKNIRFNEIESFKYIKALLVEIDPDLSFQAK